MRGYLVALAMALLACLRISGQRLETTFSVAAAGVQPLQPEVVRMSADDPGTLLSRPSCVEDSGGILDGVFLKEADEAFSVSLQSA